MPTQDPLFLGAREVSRRLRAAGYEAYLAGGCVRDRLRGFEPKDYDVTSNATPEQVTALFPRTVQVGAAFGVVRVLIGRGLEYEVATYRTERDYSDGRRPDKVAYSQSKEEDVQRRDFTINALLMDAETEEVLDYVDGQRDLQAGIIRAVGDAAERFREDRLRMLRAIRFASRFAFTIEGPTFEAIKAASNAIGAVSVERIVQELNGIWTSAAPGLGFQLLRETGLWHALFPNESFAAGEGTIEERLTRLAALDLSAEDRALVAWSLLLGGLASSTLEHELRRLKMSRDAMRTVARICEYQPTLDAPAVELPSAFGAASMRLGTAPDFHLHVASERARRGPTVVDANASWMRLLAHLDAHPLPTLPLVTGEDLKTMGVEPGPKFKELLRAVEDEVLERRIVTREQALAFVRLRV